jgi:transposase
VGYREMSVAEIREVLRHWLRGEGLRGIARHGQVDRKTARRYVEKARSLGLSREGGEEQLDEEFLSAVVSALQAGRPGGARGASWRLCEQKHKSLETWVGGGLRLTKVHELLQREVGPRVPYRTLHRYVGEELRVGRPRRTIRIDDCEPGSEVQIDFGRMGELLDPDTGRRRRVWALIFTAVYSRHMFVWLAFRQTVEDVIEGCERAWAFFGGVFRVLIPDNLKAVVSTADPLAPKFNEAFLEYSQARGFVIDSTRVRDPTGKARVERSVPYVRESFFRGEEFRDRQEAQERVEQWCLQRAGQRLHGTTQRRPLEVFEGEECPRLSPAPAEPYDLPLYCDVKVHRDQHITVAKALYSLPEDYIGERVHVRADQALVRIYCRRQLIKTHARQPPGGRSSDPRDFSEEELIYARRDGQSLRAKAEQAGPSVGEYARRILDTPEPWRRMRALYRLQGLVQRFGRTAVDKACERALELDVVDVTRIDRMVSQGLEASPSESARPCPPPDNVIRLRFARPASHFALTDKEQGP